MRITNITVPGLSNGSFAIVIGDPESYIQINLNEEESDRFRVIAYEIFGARQKSIAKDIAEASLPLLADFSEVQA